MDGAGEIRRRGPRDDEAFAFFSLPVSQLFGPVHIAESRAEPICAHFTAEYF
jgi:hypothetical protein